MARAADTERTGSAGTTAVILAFEKLHWGPARNDWHDLGIDLFVQVRDERRFDKLTVIGVQVKAGKSYFKSPVKEDGKVIGWTYTDDAKRFDDWVMHGLPHLLVLHDRRSGNSYWAHVTQESIRLTKRGCKLFVPRDQQLRSRCRPALMEVAATQRSPAVPGGISWNAGADAVPPGRRWRHALVTARTVAPHPNRTGERALRPEEATALAVRARFRDWTHIAERFGETPSFEDAVTSSEWGWRFAGGLARLITSGNLDSLEDAQRSAEDPDELAASTVALACAYAERDRFDDALGVLSEATGADKLGPVDHAWLLMQQARIYAEIGRVKKARRLAAASQRTLVGEHDDVTAAAIAAAAAGLLFTTSGWMPGQLAETLSQTDTVASWWRSQDLSRALGAFFDRHFDRWTQHQAVHFVNEDPIQQGLLAATLAADYSGDHQAWRYYGAKLAQNALLNAIERADVGSAEDAIDDLRRTLDSAAFAKAARILRQLGPILALKGAVERISDKSWTRSTVSSNFKAWSEAGDLLSQARADHAAKVCIDAMLAADPWLIKRTRPRFNVANQALPALARVLTAASPSFHVEAADLYAVIAEEGTDALLRQDSRRLVLAIDWEVVPVELQNRIVTSLSLVLEDASFTRAPLARLASVGNELARDQLAALAEGGDLLGMAYLEDLEIVPEEARVAAIRQLAERLNRTVDAAESGAQSFGSELDAGLMLNHLNLATPDAADWDTIVRLVSCSLLPAEDKGGTVNHLATVANKIPEDVRAELADRIAAVGTSPTEFYFQGSMALPSSRLAFRLGVMSEAEFRTLISKLVASREPSDRAASAALIAEHGCADLIQPLAALSNDPTLSVRIAAAEAIGAFFLRHSDDETSRAMLLLSLSGDGTATISATLRGLHRDGPLDEVADQVRDRLAVLQRHPSAIVRHQLQWVLGDLAPPEDEA